MTVSASGLAAARRNAERDMQDTCQVKRRTGRAAQNETSGREEDQYAALFTSPCKVQGSSSSSSDPAVRTVTIGGVERPVIEGGVHLPVSAQELLPGDRIVITKVGPLTDPQVLGNTYQVAGFGGKSYATARRLDVVEV